MKELSIEEKAKRYDEAIKKAESLYKVAEPMSGCNVILETIFPELKESEDERIRKELLEHCKDQAKPYIQTGYKCPQIQSWIAWLEKQRSKDNDEDADILHRFSFYSYKDEPNILYLSGLYVNEECRNKGIGTKILEVADEVAKSLNCHAIRLKTKKDSNAERLYQTHGYNSLTTEGKDEIWLEKQDEQKPIDKVEPKFKVGDWVVNEFGHLKHITKIKNNCYYAEGEFVEWHGTFEYGDTHFRLWTIQDAKDGDILSYVTDEEDLWIMIYWSLYEPYDGFVHYHALLVKDDFTDKGTCCICIDDLKPATKEQRDLLFKKMHEAGYEWDADKKELKKGEQKSIKTCAEYYNNGRELKMPALSEFQDKLADILMFREYDGPDETEDDIAKGRLEYELAAIRLSEELLPLAVKQKPTWSEVDDAMIIGITDLINKEKEFAEAYEISCYDSYLKFINNIKYRVQPQPKQEWSEEDERIRQLSIDLLGVLRSQGYAARESIDWLKSLRPQSHWKPSEEQMKVLRYLDKGTSINDFDKRVLHVLIDELEKLKE